MSEKNNFIEKNWYFDLCKQLEDEDTKIEDTCEEIYFVRKIKGYIYSRKFLTKYIDNIRNECFYESKHFSQMNQLERNFILNKCWTIMSNRIYISDHAKENLYKRRIPEHHLLEVMKNPQPVEFRRVYDDEWNIEDDRVLLRGTTIKNNKYNCVVISLRINKIITSFKKSVLEIKELEKNPKYNPDLKIILD